MLRTLNSDENKRRTTSLFGMPRGESSLTATIETTEEEASRKFNPNVTIVVPSKARQAIRAHAAEASCVR